MPLFFSVVLELSAFETGVRILPLAIALVLAAAGIPKLRPHANPRRVVRVGLLSMFVGISMLVAGMDPGANAVVVMVPMLFMGFGSARCRRNSVRSPFRRFPTSRPPRWRPAERRDQPWRVAGHRALAPCSSRR